MVKVAVFGSRDFSDYHMMRLHLLTELENGEFQIISGGAKGADTLAEKFAQEFNLPLIVFEADWKEHGRSAGFIRNHDIIRICDKAICFWNGRSPGSRHSMELCKKYNKPLKVIHYLEDLS